MRQEHIVKEFKEFQKRREYQRKMLNLLKKLNKQVRKKKWKKVWEILNEERRLMEVEEVSTWLKEILKDGCADSDTIVGEFYGRIQKFSCELNFDESDKNEKQIVDKLPGKIRSELKLHSIPNDREFINWVLDLCKDNENDKSALEGLLTLMDNSRIDYVNYEVASEFVGQCLSQYGKEALYDLWDQFRNFQNILYAIDFRFRDHLVHSIRSYILGIAILNAFRKYVPKRFEKVFGVYGSFKPEYYPERDLSWSLQFMSTLAFLFHDLGYPVEKIQVLNERVRGYFNSIPIYNVECFRLEPDLFAIGLINEYLRLLSVKFLHNPQADSPSPVPVEDPDLHSRLLEGFRKLDHGVHAAVILMDMIQRTIAPRHLHPEEYRGKTFRTLVAFAAQAIAIHNIKKPGEDWMSRPFSFIVALADALQEWKRPYHDFAKGLVETLYEIDIGIHRSDSDAIELTLLLDLRPGQQEAIKKNLQWYKVNKIIESLEQLGSLFYSVGNLFRHRIIVIYNEEGRTIIKSFGSHMNKLRKLEEKLEETLKEVKALKAWAEGKIIIKLEEYKEAEVTGE